MGKMSRAKGTSTKKVPKAVKTYVNRSISRNIQNKQVTFALPDLADFDSIPNTWTEYDFVTSISQGEADGQRIGREIKLKSLRVKGVITGGQNENLLDDPYNVVRMVLGEYNNDSSSPLATYSVGINYDISKKLENGVSSVLLKKHLDKYMTFEAACNEKGGGDGYTGQVKQFSIHKRFKGGLTVRYPADGNQTNPSRRLILSMISDSGTQPNPGVIAGYATLTFEDA